MVFIAQSNWMKYKSARPESKSNFVKQKSGGKVAAFLINIH